MKISVYIKEENLNRLNTELASSMFKYDEPYLPADFIKTSSAEFVNFHGFIHVILSYEQYIMIKDRMQII